MLHLHAGSHGHGDVNARVKKKEKYRINIFFLSSFLTFQSKVKSQLSDEQIRVRDELSEIIRWIKIR